VRRGWSERDALVADDLVFDIEVQFGRRGAGLGVVKLVAVFRLAGQLQRQIALRGDDLYFLIGVGLRCWDPDANFFSGGKISHGEGIMKREVTGIPGRWRTWPARIERR